jgi:mRNA interferase MazF
LARAPRRCRKREPAYLLWKKIGTPRAWKLMTNYKRGEVILVKFPYADMVRYKKRPALVVQDETGLSQRAVVQITSNLDRTGDTRVLVRKDSPDGQAMGILSDFVIVADHLATVLPREIDKVMGRCTCMPEVDTALKRVLGL